METSALDGGNVETAFQNILAGNIQLINILHVLDRNIKFFFFFFFFGMFRNLSCRFKQGIGKRKRKKCSKWTRSRQKHHSGSYDYK